MNNELDCYDPSWRKYPDVKGFGVGNLRERDHLVDPDLDGRMVLRWVFRKWNLGLGLDRRGSG